MINGNEIWIKHFVVRDKKTEATMYLILVIPTHS